MFTGLIQDLGTIEAREVGEDGTRLRIATRLAVELNPGDSVAVNGVCLTAVEVGDGGFAADVMNQTLSITSLSPLAPGDRANLELAMQASDRLGGHLVQGHVDGTAEVVSVSKAGFAARLRARAEPALLRYVVEHGSVTLDGVSLTVSALGEDWLEVTLIPETLKRTSLGAAEPGQLVNVECDVLARYVERLMQPLTPEEDR